MNKNLLISVVFLLFSAGCASNPSVNPSLGYGEGRRLVIIGEKINPNIAYYYQRTYDAQVWFTPTEGKITDSGNRLLESFGPTRGMKVLINELGSINYTIGRWEIIIPGIAEHYFLATLNHMKDGSLSKARGTIALIDSSGNKEIEAQVKRVTEGSFFVDYEFHKDLQQQ